MPLAELCYFPPREGTLFPTAFSSSPLVYMFRTVRKRERANISRSKKTFFLFKNIRKSLDASVTYRVGLGWVGLGDVGGLCVELGVWVVGGSKRPN